MKMKNNLGKLELNLLTPVPAWPRYRNLQKKKLHMYLQTSGHVSADLGRHPC